MRLGIATEIAGALQYLHSAASLPIYHRDIKSTNILLDDKYRKKKPILEARSDDGRSLATHFKLAMKECNCFDIFDARVVKEGGKDEIMRVANLAKRCLNLNGRKRPTMKQVAMELEGIRMSNGAPAVQEQYEELEYDEAELVATWDTASTSTSSYVINNVVSE
ncbi:hypothetical protein RJ639_016127 [Escallonia herrerae]|uniref:Protein kinase domain-containing protein n=1 Tax=Escallonia herrerae TaxID=1293975 RepID=A0AA89AJX7_9ASTE|nr:hypothetical protein RJ639_024556 [Escallonia herrerae]KAK3005010.1 hypothetical protein RJ639_016127 [Escallonia herrerae]